MTEAVKFLKEQPGWNAEIETVLNTISDPQPGVESATPAQDAVIKFLLDAIDNLSRAVRARTTTRQTARKAKRASKRKAKKSKRR